MAGWYWTRWPSREGLEREAESRPRRVLTVLGRIVLLAVVGWGTFANGKYTGWAVAAAAGGLAASAALCTLYLRATRAQRPTVSYLLGAALVGAAGVADWGRAYTLADLLWIGLAVIALVRLPPAPALLTATAALGSYTAASWASWLSIAATIGGVVLLGFLLRLDTEARGTARRLLAQERAARAAEAESAALAERARIAREIHDVLAHSLSAQLVHLEAARLMLDAGTDREQIRERVVAARRMAQDGLAETRQALSALRGEFTPVGEFLVELTGRERAVLTVTGTPRPLAAEPALAVRRTAQEAVTNVRKHAPGARCSVELRYLDGAVELEVRNSRAPRGESSGELATSGSGYGLLGMRERAELLGGTLLAGPEDGGWRVLLRVPA
ncbi:sensor histidine kinase [Streptomyces rubellomurinus]|uniref:histidine kinase n=2 Tax=Streptomyces TaxID=1883 RepID=A0A0F2TBK4_STRR3|nr:histidine kinase [Streptomyces rubellomurinus]KJS57574.1 histidine kinase [Streptomyces rubellomurinus subsp. indigoferus]KJS60578.1 histidine kinase [Streptomyces rubellomurinus]